MVKAFQPVDEVLEQLAAATSDRERLSRRRLHPLARLVPLRLRQSRVASGAHSPDVGWLGSFQLDRS